MAKKTLYKIFAFGVSVITITAVLILSVFYSYSDNQLKEQLRVVESVVENQLAQDDDTAFISNHIDKNVRITLVAKDGTVIADSQESANKLENHLNRQEIQQALREKRYIILQSSLITAMFCVFRLKLKASASFFRIILYISFYV